jgi:integrase
MKPLIDTETKRKRLEFRHAPYWQKVVKGRSIGYRKGTKQIAWMGRMDIGGKFKYTSFENSENWNYEDALESVTEWFSTLVNIDVGARDMNIKDVVNHYEQRMSIQKKPRNAQENSARVRKHISENLSATKANNITKRQIIKFRDDMVATGDDESIRKSKVSANRVLNIFKAVLNLAYEDKLIGTKSAWDTVKPFEDVSEARKLYLTDKQVKAYLKATTGAFYDLCKACVLTGNRVGSLTSALVKDFDAIDGSIRLESRKGNGKVKTWDCYLSDDALKFFKEITKNKLPNAPLLSKDDGEPWGKNSYRRTLLAAKTVSKMPDSFDLYAFRHYHISKALLAGIQAQVIAENCGTSIRMLEKHYAKFVGSDRRAMMNLMELEQ